MNTSKHGLRCHFSGCIGHQLQCSATIMPSVDSFLANTYNRQPMAYPWARYGVSNVNPVFSVNHCITVINMLC